MASDEWVKSTVGEFSNVLAKLAVCRVGRGSEAENWQNLLGEETTVE